MRKIRQFRDRVTGVVSPWSGSTAPMLLGLAVLAALSVGCGEQEHQESLPILQVGMTKDVAPIYDDGEMEIYEVKKGIAFPILQPAEVTRRELNNLDVDPYGRQPWVTTKDIEVQVTWTISNLDDEEHVVERIAARLRGIDEDLQVRPRGLLPREIVERERPDRRFGVVLALFRAEQAAGIGQRGLPSKGFI